MKYGRLLLLIAITGCLLGAVSYCDPAFQVVFNKYCWSSYAIGDWRVPLMSYPVLGFLGLLSGISFGIVVAPSSFLMTEHGKLWAAFVGGKSVWLIRARAVFFSCLFALLWTTLWSIALSP